MIYLDHAATTPVPRAVADAMYEVLTEQFGNPSSQYPMGLEMKRRVEVWRKTVADALGCGAKQLFFTSCGTEADNWAVTAACWQNRHLGRHIVTTAVEHSAVLEACRWMERQGYEVTYLVPAQDGSLSAEQVLAAVRQDTALVSCMLVNNELGNIYPIAEIARGLAVKNPQTLLHTDAVQGFLKVPCSAKTLGADFLTISAHKIGGPKGIGALYIGPRVRNPKPLLAGGGQEEGMRSGTEPMPQIAAFGEAVRIAKAEMPEANKRMEALRAQCVQTLTDTVPDIVFLGGGSAHILSLSLPGYRSEVLMNYLEAKGIYVSKSSACKRGKRSHVLEAIGAPDKVVDGALRVSFSRYTTAEECAYFCEALAAARKELYPSL